MPHKAAHASGFAAGVVFVLFLQRAQQLTLCIHCAGDDLSRIVEAAHLSQSLQGMQQGLLLAVTRSG
jgi:hypothetical protein